MEKLARPLLSRLARREPICLHGRIKGQENFPGDMSNRLAKAFTRMRIGERFIVVNNFKNLGDR